MNSHYLQHVPFEGLGSIEPWLRERGIEIARTRLYAGEQLPSHLEPDLLIVLGGPMGVYDTTRFPWIMPEREFISRVIDRGTPVLGICLGAQLIAAALGAQVYRNREPEIGWFPVRSIRPGGDALFPLPESFEAFHWHGDTFDLPAGAEHLAESDACVIQAFCVGKSVVGLQFHLETTPESARLLVENCRDELIPSTYVQNESSILTVSSERYERINLMMAQLLGTITGFT